MKSLSFPVFLILILISLPVLVKEGGDQYPNGAENWYAGSIPTAGLYYINYLGYYTGTLKDGTGGKAMFDGETPAVNASFDALRLAYITHFKLLGANYGMHAIVPVVYQSLDMGGRESDTNVGDTTVNPVILGWHRESWNFVTGIDIFLPTGYYKKDDARVSIGANYFDFDPLPANSYISNRGWELSGKFMYNLKTTNGATQYHSGQEFHTDFAAGEHVGKWMLGATGYALKQTTDDTISGRAVAAATGLWDAGRRGQVLAVGPSIGYIDRLGDVLMLDWQHELLIRNRFGGDKLWFKGIIPLDALFENVSSR